MAIDALAPCVARTSAAVVLTMQDNKVLVFPEEEFQPPVPSQLIHKGQVMEVHQLIAKPGSKTAALPWPDPYISGLVQNCCISTANALEILQSCNKPSIWFWRFPGKIQHQRSSYFTDLWGIQAHVNGLVQDCSISTADALEIPQSCTKPSIRFWRFPNKIQHRRSSYFTDLWGIQTHING